MKKLNLSLCLSLIAVLVGCSSVDVKKSIIVSMVGTNVVSITTNTTFKASAPLWSKAAFQGLSVDGYTKTTSSLLKMNTANSEPVPESITATGSALGEMIGAAAKTAAKP